jgi:hypothetical protein
MCQEASLQNEFDIIEAKCRGVYEQIYIRIQIRNLDEDVIRLLTIHIRISFAAELGNHIQEVCAIALWKGNHIQEVCAVALWKRTHYHLVDGWLRF